MATIDSFIAYKVQRNAITPATQVQYRRLLARWHSWAKLERVDPARPAETDMSRYLDQLRIRPASLHSHIVVLRSWGRFLLDTGVVLVNPAATVTSVRVRHALRPPATELEIRMLLASIDTSTVSGARLLALVMLWYGCGLRVTESLTLDSRDVDLDARELRVLGKGDVWRTVVIPAGAVDPIAEWIARRTGPTMFPGRGQHYYSRSGAYQMLQREAVRAGLRRSLFHPHMLRHACAVHMLRGGANLRTIQRQLGHSDIKMTERYLAIDVSDIRAGVDLAHPLR